MLVVAAQTILETLDKIPNADNRTQIGFIGVDNSLHFVGLNVMSYCIV
jgi:protein transport protein SEC24